MAEGTTTTTTQTPGADCTKSVFGYWKLRGRSLPIRLLLEYTQEPYESCDYPIPEFANQKGIPIPELLRRRCEAERKQDGQWFRDKYQLGLDFPNLPYFLVGGAKSDLRLTQTYAICRYLARKHHLEGNDERQRIHTDMLEQVYDEARNAHRMIVWPDSEYEPKRLMYINHVLPKYLALLSKYLDGKPYFLHNTTSPMYVDILLFDFLDIQQRYASEVVAKFPNLAAFIERMQQVPAVKSFMQRKPEFITPVYPTLCYWSGAPGDKSGTECSIATASTSSGTPCSGSKKSDDSVCPSLANQNK